MKISVDDTELFVLSDMRKKVLAHAISSETIESDLKRRLQWVLMHKYEHTLEILKKEWVPKLVARGLKAIPANNDELCSLIFAEEDYTDRAAKDKYAKDKVLNPKG
jgi:hypothetical protein